MSTTFLTHTKGGCGGPVVLNITQSAKIIAPSFSVGIAGIQSLMMDIQMHPSGLITPKYECSKCLCDIEDSQIDTHMSANCSVCGDSHVVEDISVLETVSAVCSNCLNSMKLSRKSDMKFSDRIREYASLFNIGDRTKASSLGSVLRNKIPVR